jgi:hypothetical protein
MTDFRPIIAVGLDEHDAIDFRVSPSIGDIGSDRMQEFRAMIPVAIAKAERMWLLYGAKTGQDERKGK